MWLLSSVIWLSSLLVAFSQDLDEKGIRCYDCNSFNPHCRDQVNQSSPTEGFAVYTHCPKTHRCFIRKDKDGVIVRGCADGWRFSLVDIEYLGCKEQDADWLGPQVWCLCDDDLCNQVPMAQLNRGQYLGMSESSEYLSVNKDLDVEHELTGWKGVELLEKHLEKEDENESSDGKTTTTLKTTTTKAPKTTTPQSVFTSKPDNSTKVATHKSTSLRATTPKLESNSTKIKSNAEKISKHTNTTTKTTTQKSTVKAVTTKMASTTTVKSKSTSKASTAKTTTKSPTGTKAQTTRRTTQRYRQSTTRGAIKVAKTTATTTRRTTKLSTTPVKTTPTTSKTTTTQVTKKVDMPWWLWHVVSSTPKTTESTTTAPLTRATRRPGGRRRTYLKPRVSLVTKHRSDDSKGKGISTTPTPEEERWTWSPSWWDKWWRPGTRRQRRPKRPTVKYPRRPRPTQGRGHYWWLAPVGPTRSGPKNSLTKKSLHTTIRYPLASNNLHPGSRKFSATTKKFSPVTKKFSPTTKKISASTKKPIYSTKKQTLPSKKTQPSYPQHIIGTSTPEPSRMYPKFPNWGRRLTNPKKSIYPVITTRKPRPTTRIMTRRRPMKLTSYSTRYGTTTSEKKTTRKVPFSTVKVTTRRRKPTTLSRRRFHLKNRPKPETQQKDSEPFFCWDCYSASTNCRDVVNSPYSYYVGRTPCPYTKKCFVRKDDGVIYRGCADGWTSSLIDRNYNGCKVQYTWGRPVEWCFCDSHLCNGESLKHIKTMYNTHNTDKNAILDLPSGDVHRKKHAISNRLR